MSLSRVSFDFFLIISICIVSSCKSRPHLESKTLNTGQGQDDSQVIAIKEMARNQAFDPQKKTILVTYTNYTNFGKSTPDTVNRDNETLKYLASEINKRPPNDKSIHLLIGILKDLQDFSKIALYERDVLSIVSSKLGSRPLSSIVMLPPFQKKTTPYFSIKNSEQEYYQNFLFIPKLDPTNKNFYLSRDTFAKYLDSIATIYPPNLFNYVLQIKSHGSRSFLMTNRYSFADAADLRTLLSEIDRRFQNNEIESELEVKEKIGLDSEAPSGLSMLDVYRTLSERPHMTFPIVFFESCYSATQEGAEKIKYLPNVYSAFGSGSNGIKFRSLNPSLVYRNYLASGPNKPLGPQFFVNELNTQLTKLSNGDEAIDQVDSNLYKKFFAKEKIDKMEEFVRGELNNPN